MKKYNSNFTRIETVGGNTIYTLYDGKKEQNCISVRVTHRMNSEFERLEISNKIVEESSEYLNGYKVVGTENGEYAYIRQEDGVLLPVRFDIAGDFNEYGLAMVGRNGKVSWINKKMEYLTTDGVFVSIDPENKFEEFKGWSSVTQFSENTASLSRLYNGKDGDTSYLTTDGEIMKFYQLYGSEEISKYPKTSFRDGKDFNEQGYAFTASDMVLLATGYCLSLKDMLEIAKQNGWLSQLLESTAKLKKRKAPDNKQGN